MSFGFGYSAGLMSSDGVLQPYRQLQVNVPVRFDDSTRNAFVSNETDNRRAIWGGSNYPGVFDALPWEPVFEYEDGLERDSTEPRILPALNGLGTHEMNQIDEMGNEKWLAEVMQSKIRVIGHIPEKKDSLIGQNNQQLGCQIAGARVFRPIRPAPLLALLKARVPTKTEASDYLKNAPDGHAQGKVPLIYDVYEAKDVADTFKLYNREMIEDEEAFKRTLGAKYQRTTRLVNTLTKLHNFCLLNGISYIYTCVNNNVFQITIPADATVKITTDVGTLNVDETANYLGTMAAKMNLLPESNYAQIQRNDTSEHSRDQALRLRRELLACMFPDNMGTRFFGFNKRTGALLGLDPMRKVLRRGTLQGDMIETISNASTEYWAATGDFIYHDTRTVQGRVIFPAQQFSFGAFL